MISNHYFSKQNHEKKKRTFLSEEDPINDVNDSIRRHDVSSDDLSLVDEDAVRVTSQTELRILQCIHALRVRTNGGTARDTIDHVITQNIWRSSTKNT